jgi:Mycothiol maleylpyruvate isomerase N-terminal domain
MKKQELLGRVNEVHDQVTNVLNELTEKQAMRVGLNAHWSVKDLLAHLASWKERGVAELVQIENGTWQPQKIDRDAVDQFNAAVVDERRTRSMAVVRADFERAHDEMLRLISALPDDVDESSPAFRVVNGGSIRHVAHHAAQLVEWKLKLASGD